MQGTQHTHFVFMAAIGPDGARVELGGAFTPSATTTRGQVYQEFREKVQAKFGCPASAFNVTAFSLELNDIGA